MTKTICPLCQSDNNCMAHSNKPCWCKDVLVPQQLIDLIPEELKDKSCICLSCIQSFSKQTLVVKPY